MSDDSLGSLIKLIVLIALTPFALICNLILVYYLMMDRILRRAIHNHGMLALLFTTLCTNLIEVPRIINYLNIGIVFPQNEINCLIWQWCDYLLFAMVNLFILWISIERYLIIFHHNLYRTTNHRLFYHYLPLIVIPIYVILFYVIVIYVYPCKSQYDYHQPLCGSPCYTIEAAISMYDLIVHTWIPLFGGIILNIIFLIRVIYRKRVGLQHENAHQHRHRKMVIQVLCLSSLYIVCQSPFSGILFIQLFVVVPQIIQHIHIYYFYYLFWFLTLLLPLVSLACIPEIVKKVRNRFRPRIRQNATVVPMINTIQFQKKNT